MQEPRRSGGSHDASTQRRSHRYAPVETKEPPVSNRGNGSGSVKYILLGLILLLIVAILVVLCVRCSRSSSSGVENAAAANMTSTVLMQDSYGKDMSDNIDVTASALLPEGASATDSVAMNITWVGKTTPTYPMILSISDPAFADGDGLIVFRSANGQWEKLDTYIVSDHSITFLLDSLGTFAFVPYSKFSTPTPEPTATPEATPTPSPTPSTSPSPTPSATPSPTPTSGSGGYSYSSFPSPNVTTVPTQNPAIEDPTVEEPTVVVTPVPDTSDSSNGNATVVTPTPDTSNDSD